MVSVRVREVGLFHTTFQLIDIGLEPTEIRGKK